MKFRLKGMICLLLLLIILSFVSTVFYDHLRLQDPERLRQEQLAVRDALKSRNDTCTKPWLKFLLTDQETLNISGKLAEDTKTSRKLAKFLILPRVVNMTKINGKCHVESDVIRWTLVNVIKSSIDNTARRKAIRSTWGTVGVVDGIKVINVFVVGTSANVEEQVNLKRESDHHGDILQFDEADSAKTVPEKVLAGMQWSSISLKSDTLYSSMDDDFVVHVPNLAAYLRKEFLEPEACYPLKTVSNVQQYCPCLERLPLLCVYSYQDHDIPVRDRHSKWYISNDIYPGHRWPVHCRGGMYIAPVEMVKSLFRISRRTEYLYLDDVWITGIMRRKLGNGNGNIVPAPFSRRDSEFLRKKPESYSDDFLLQHLWGNMEDDADIPKQIVDLWTKWNVDLSSDRICTTSAEITPGVRS